MRDLGFRLVTRNLAPVQLDFMLRAELGELYREEIQRLSALLDRDLSHWLHRTDEAAPLSQAASAQR
jgi:hypothetical protein